MTDQLLTVRDLCKTFRVPGARRGKAELRALDGINLDLARGETLGLVGESAAASPPWPAPC
jgi:oligopeptide transport system ATP-binding protein